MHRRTKSDTSNSNKARPPSSECDETAVEAAWSTVSGAIRDVLRKQNTLSLSFEEIYRNAYRVVSAKRWARAYAGTSDTVSEHLRTGVRATVLGSLDGDRRGFLRTLDECWRDHRTSMAAIRDLLVYADKERAKNGGGGGGAVDGVYDLGLALFRDIVVRHDRIADRLRESLLDAVTRERNGEAIDRTAVKDACGMLVALDVRDRGVYRADFEIPFLARTAEYYDAEGGRLLAEKYGALAYMRNAADRIDEEAERARDYLQQDASAAARVVRVVEDELVKKRLKAVVEMDGSGVVSMLRDRRTRELSSVRELLQSKYPDGLGIVTECLSEHLRQEGKSLVKVEDGAGLNPVTFVQNLLDFKDKLEFVHRDLIKTRVESVEETISDLKHFLIFNPKLPGYISFYIDKKLRKGNRGVIDESALDVALDKAMALFRYLQDKDVFETYYRQHLAKRLLLSKSVSSDNEQSMISKLKTECGSQFTSKLEGMFKDMLLSTTVMDSFKQYKALLPSNTPNSIDINVRVLTSRFWPLPTVTPKCILPIYAQSAYESFRTFYLDKNCGRRLRLQPQLGSADIIAIFDDNGSMSAAAMSTNDSGITVGSTSGTSMQTNNAGKSLSERKYCFQVSTYQMAILMLFNSYDKMTMEMIMRETDINEKDLTRALQSLSVGKTSQRLLLKIPETKEVELHHEFSINESYTSKLDRVRIKSNTTIGENETDRLNTKDKVSEDRKHEIEAVIVRVMKARKKLTYNALIMEVTKQLRSRFMPSPVMIKKRIECLANRKYIVHALNDCSTYIFYTDAEQRYSASVENIENKSHYTAVWI